MSDTARVALALAAGYYLGRRHKLRMAAMLAAASVAGKYRKGGGGLLAQGSKILGSSPEIDELTGRLRGQIMDVGKAAVMAAATRQINSLTEKLQERTESLQSDERDENDERDQPGEPEDEYAGDEEGDEEDEYSEDERDDEDAQEEDQDEGSEPVDEAAEPEDAEETSEPAEEPEPRRTRTSRSHQGTQARKPGTGRRRPSPVTRTAG
ncbi:hypothetical protein E1267_24415 [Nonomuraea longispora]|uniref:Histone protein n=1 Tax=Nonomuraea longispora TaxID=1848320 RepID=A0A4R4N5J9_9ACTN|nr:hypothetical protein [Nonomuraea longispora]TDC03985.1 hypothetical protein E1267_24415 [Nonomuraea longispora]